ESRAAILHQAGRRDAREFRHDRHPVACALELARRWMRLRIYAAFDEMEQRVALAVARIHKVGHGADRLARGREDQLDRVVEAAAGEYFEAGAVRPHAPDTRRQAFELLPILTGDFESVPAVGQVQPAVWTEERPMQAGGVGGEIPAGDEHL